jgi:hypothetical protein
MYQRDSYVVSKHSRTKTSEWPKGMKEILLNGDSFKIGDPVPWGKFNVEFIGANDIPAGHESVLIRHLNPFSYSFYDSHGYGWRNPNSFFYRWRDKLDSIVGDAPVNFNDSNHQCTAAICRLFSKIRATYPNLSNEEYNQELKKTALEIASDPNFYVESAAIPVYQVLEDETAINPRVGWVQPSNMKEALRLRVGEEPLERPNEPGAYYHREGDVWAAPLVLQKAEMPLIENPQEEVRYSTAAPLPVPTRTLMLPQTPGREVQTLASLASLAPAPAPAPAPYIVRSSAGVGFGLGRYKTSEPDKHILIGDELTRDVDSQPVVAAEDKYKFAKKYLKGQGVRATKKNIDKICNIMDVEGVVFE